MCKLIAMSSLSCKTLKQASRLIKASSEMLGSSQRDGFGYAIKASESVFIERYLNPASCKGMGTLKASRDILPASLQTQLSFGVDYDQHGILPSKTPLLGSFIAHGRTATCGKNIANTHPFTGFKDGKQWTIAHNGVVDWSGEVLPLQTTCDSEHILNCFLHLEGEQSFCKGLAGYAAVVGINPQGEMFALRDDRAPLYVQYIKELNNYILCTDSDHCGKLSEMLCEFNGIKPATITTPMMIASYVKHTFHANGEVSSVTFPKFESSSRSISSASIYRSLGSAGAAGYRSAWDDDDYNPYGYRIATPPASGVSTPNTPSVAGSAEVSAEKLDEYRKQQLRRHQSNASKPWKHKK
jgi:Glutamine amidotransferase domain